MKETRILKQLYRLIELRKTLDDKISSVNASYAPKLEKLITAREAKTAGARHRVHSATLKIQAGVLSLTGTEMSALRTRYPMLKELPPAVRRSGRDGA